MRSLPPGAGLGVLQRLPPSWILVHRPQDFGREAVTRTFRGSQAPCALTTWASLDARPRPVPLPAPARGLCARVSCCVRQPHSGRAGGHSEAVSSSWGHPHPPVRAPHNILRLPTAGPSLSHPSTVATGPHVLPRGFSAPCSPPGNWRLFKTLLGPSSSGCPLPFPGSPTDEMHHGLFSSTRSPPESYFGHITVKSPGTKPQGVTGVWPCVSKKTRPGRGWGESGGCRGNTQGSTRASGAPVHSVGTPDPATREATPVADLCLGL